MEFKTLRGHRILIEKPMRPKSAIELTEAQQQQLDMEFMSQWTRLKVHAVGDSVTGLAAGDEVYIGSALAHAEVLDIEGVHYLLTNEHEVAIVW
jgi:hypothetical protein